MIRSEQKRLDSILEEVPVSKGTAVVAIAELVSCLLSAPALVLGLIVDRARVGF